jgi:hypothetical protein
MSDLDGGVHTLIAPIYRPDERLITRAVGDPEKDGAVRAETRYRILAVGNGHTLVLCEPVTGRTHQLRVHFSHLGYPILGDDLYGSPSELIGRHALHALSLSVPMPFSRMREDVNAAAVPFVGCSDNDPLNAPSPDGFLHTWAPLPADMEHVLSRLFPQSPIRTKTPTVGLLKTLTLTEP